jgi:hypothetical protein
MCYTFSSRLGPEVHGPADMFEVVSDFINYNQKTGGPCIYYLRVLIIGSSLKYYEK